MYGMQVKLHDGWKWVKPTGGEPYKYPTQEEAYEMLRICYPDQVRQGRLGMGWTVRIKEFEYE